MSATVNQAPKPSVSVVIPAFNGEKYVAAAIESVFAQLFSDWELIVVDDCSKDRTWEIIQAYAADDRVRLLRNEQNLGQFPTHNLGADVAKGRYIKFLHADDLLYPHCLEIMVALMDAYPDAGMGISSNPAPWCAPKLLQPQEIWAQYVLRQSSLMAKGPICSIFRTGTFRKTGGYDHRFDSSDVKMNLTVAMNCPILILPDGLTWYRTHGDQVSVKMRLNDTAQKERAVWIHELLSDTRCPLNDSQRAHAKMLAEKEFMLLCRHYLLRKNPKRAYQLWKLSGQSWLRLLTYRKKLPKNIFEREQLEDTLKPNWEAFPGQQAIQKQDDAKIEKPLVTVIVDASNSIGQLETTLESVLAQRFASYELFIVVGGLSEKLQAWLTGYKNRLKIKIIKSENGADKWANFNLAAKSAGGKFLKFLDSGDLMYPNCLQIMVSMMIASEGAVLGVSGGCGPYRAGISLDPDASLDSELYGTPRFLESPSALILDNGKFVEAGCFEPEFFPPERRLQLKLSRLGPVVLIQKGLVQYRLTGASPFYGEDHWPLGWAQGYDWIIEWLLSIDHKLDQHQLHLAISNLLRVAWQRRGRAVDPAREKQNILNLAHQHGVTMIELNEKPPFMRKGGSEEVARSVKERMLEMPDWKAFGFGVDTEAINKKHSTTASVAYELGK